VSDARFEEGVERPLRLRAESPDDLTVISALVQDAVGETSDIAWMPRRKRFSMLINRFRWEDAGHAARERRPFERVRAILAVENALAARARGIDPRDRELVVSLLALAFEPGEEGSGRLSIVLAGDGEIALEVESLEVTLTDVTRPYVAPSRRSPSHPEE
jgi:Protein of unknown function (DUF2948)